MSAMPTSSAYFSTQTQQQSPISHSPISHPLRCSRSGVTLAFLNICISDGHQLYLSEWSTSITLHPFYNLPFTVLAKKLESALLQGESKEWNLPEKEQQRIQILVSATLHSMECIKQECACLPSYPIALACAPQLLRLAHWFHSLASRRLSFPTYSISTQNNNLQWENLRFWIEGAESVITSWDKKKHALETEAQIRATEDALTTLRSKVYRRVDLNKVWNWIHLQIKDHGFNGRLSTWKDLFMNGDLEPENWLQDDVDDLIEAILEYCNIGNEIMHFIHQRLNGISEGIKEHYSGFTLIGLNAEMYRNSQEGPTEKEKQLTDSLDANLAAIGELPPKPERRSFATQGAFLQAEAKWNLLRRRWELLQQRKNSSA